MPENLINAGLSADKAQYYKTILENERIVREQADKEIIDLLHDVKQRYGSKLSTYMAKKKANQAGKPNNGGTGGVSGGGNTGRPASAASGASVGGDQAANSKKGNENKKNKKGKDQKNDPDDPWSGTDAKTDNQEDWCNNVNGSPNNDQYNGWGDVNDNNQNEDQDDNDDNNDDLGEDTNNQTNDDGWGGSAGATHNGNNDVSEGNQKTKNVNWSDNQQSNDAGWGGAQQSNDGWGNSQPTNNNNSNNNKKSSNKQDDWCTMTNNQSKGKGQNKKEANQTKAKEQTPPNKSKGKDENQTPKSKGPEASKKAPKETQSTNPKTTDDANQTSTVHSTKEFSEMKSNLLTAKLELRLLERDKSKLTDEVSSLRTERDDLLKKLTHIGQEQDTTKVRVIGLTQDLVAANEEIHKLNERIDELEAEKRSRENDVNMSENKRRSMESRYRNYQQQIADLESELSLVKEEKLEYEKQASELGKRNERLMNDLSHSKNLIRTLKDGCALVESQAKTFESRHDTVIMSKADLERELIAIKEESSRHITSINKLQKSNEQISKAFIQSVEAHDACKKEVERLHREFTRKCEGYQLENLRLVEANSQLMKVIDHQRKKH